MNIATRDFGDIEIAENEVIKFPKGLFSFEDDTEFVLLSPLGENVFPMWLQSVKNSELCLIVFDPFEFDTNYHITIEKDDLNCIDIVDNDTIDYLVIAVIPDDIKDTLINLKAPIIVNSTKNIAVQVIVAEDYPIKHPAFEKGES